MINVSTSMARVIRVMSHTPRMTLRKLNDFFNVDWYVLMHVKQSQAREKLVAHAIPKVSFDTLKSTERPFCTKRGHREYREL